MPSSEHRLPWDWPSPMTRKLKVSLTCQFILEFATRSSLQLPAWLISTVVSMGPERENITVLSHSGSHNTSLLQLGLHFAPLTWLFVWCISDGSQSQRRNYIGPNLNQFCWQFMVKQQVDFQLSSLRLRFNYGIAYPWPEAESGGNLSLPD